MFFGTPFSKNSKWNCTAGTQPMLLLAVWSLCWNAVSKGVLAQDPFLDGANSLFIGNSFFGPMARRFDEIALLNELPSHLCAVVQRPGETGSPKSLFEEPVVRAEIEEILAEGDIELFGMTVGPESEADELVSDYSNWIDVALEYNPNTAFFIGLPWPPGSPELGSTGIGQIAREGEEDILQIVSELRDLYPNNQIFLIKYSGAAAGMRRLFDYGMLPGIDAVVGDEDTSIHRDDFGHAGNMLIEIVALTWLEILYGQDAGSLDYGDWDAASVTRIVDKVVAYNDRFRA